MPDDPPRTPLEIGRLGIASDGVLTPELRVVSAAAQFGGLGVYLELQHSREGSVTLFCTRRDETAQFFEATERVAVSIVGSAPQALIPSLHAAIPLLDALQVEHRSLLPVVSAPSQPESRWDSILDNQPGGLKLTDLCDERCAFCSATPDQLRGAEIHAPLEGVKRRLDKWAAEGRREVELRGREPTLYPHLVEVIEHARRAGYRAIRMNSNGRGLGSRAFVDECARAGLTEVCLSLHASTAARSDAITLRPGGFPRKLEAIRNCLDAGILVFVNYVVHDRNVDDVLPFLRLLHEKFGTRAGVGFSFMGPEGDGASELHLLPRFAALRPHLSEALTAFPKAAGHPFYTIPPCAVEPPHQEKFRSSAGRLPGRVLAPACEPCRWKRVCPGVWPQHLEQFGEADLRPVPPQTQA